MTRRPIPAVLVPDEVALTLWGHDPASRGLEPHPGVGRPRRALIADPVPPGLEHAVTELKAGLVADDAVELAPVAVLGRGSHEHSGDASHAHDGHDHHDHGGHERHDHDGHDHHDMMAIVGEPSRDGLVMEPIELSYGPLSPSLPGGLVVSATLDGDVVCDATIQPTLSSGEGAAPDPLASAAWSAAIANTAEGAAGTRRSDAERWLAIARVELERALSHVAWLRAFGRLLGWAELVACCQPVIDNIDVVRAAVDNDGLVTPSEQALPPLALARADLDAVLALVESRRMRLRTAGLGTIRGEQLGGLAGPVARASGIAADARAGDLAYDRLGFRMVVVDGGDAWSRTEVRTREGAHACTLADEAIRRVRDSESFPASASPRSIEGPRGPVVVRRVGGELVVRAPGTDAAVGAAGAAVVGCEWADALVVVASFDLSPWQVPS